MTCATIVTTCTQRLYAGTHKYLFIMVLVQVAAGGGGGGGGGGYICTELEWAADWSL